MNLCDLVIQEEEAVLQPPAKKDLMAHGARSRMQGISLVHKIRDRWKWISPENVSEHTHTHTHTPKKELAVRFWHFEAALSIFSSAVKRKKNEQ